MALIPEPLDQLMKTLAKLPGLGRRSAQRAALHLLTDSEAMHRLQQQLSEVAHTVKTCQTCGNIALEDPCHICTSDARDASLMCVVEGVDDLWAMERSGYKGHYHILGGVVNALDGVGPEDLRIPELICRVEQGAFQEVILALGVSVDGQTTGHIIAQRLKALDISVTTLAQGIPVGAEVDYMDDGTLSLALQGRRKLA